MGNKLQRILFWIGVAVIISGLVIAVPGTIRLIYLWSKDIFPSTTLDWVFCVGGYPLFLDGVIITQLGRDYTDGD